MNANACLSFDPFGPVEGGPGIVTLPMFRRSRPAGSAPGADAVRAGPMCELGRRRTDHAAGAVHELPRSIPDTGDHEAIGLTVKSLLCDI